MSNNSRLIKSLRKYFYSGVDFPNRRYTTAVASLAPGVSRVLDIGCGRSAPELRRLPADGICRVGVDVVESFDASSEQSLHLLKSDCVRLPFADSTFDLVISGSVLEHLRAPRKMLSEVHRVLVPGGRFVFLVPNFYSYVSLGAYLIPNSMHPWLVRMMTGRSERDTIQYSIRSELHSSKRFNDICVNLGHRSWESFVCTTTIRSLPQT